MYDESIAPRLELKKTVSHPLEDVRVIGFEGRDTTYGRNAVVLKSEDVPTKQVEKDDYLKNTIAAPERVRQLMADDHFLYVLRPTRVDAVGPSILEDVDVYTFHTEYGDEQFAGLHYEDFTAYPRSRVKVGLP